MDFQAPLPPPPPPPSNVMFSLNHQAPLNLNSSQNLSDRSQLLIDIEKGKTLKKVSNAQRGLNSRPLNQAKQISSSNECNGIDNNNYNEDSINPIKNQLQAELSSTLHRRQNGGNKKPTFIVPKNTTINAINNQLRELEIKAQAQPKSTTHTIAQPATNGITQPATNGITQPTTSGTTQPITNGMTQPITNGLNQPTTNGRTTTTSTKQSNATNTTDKDEKPKLLLSHGKPNFKISSSSMSSKKFMEKDESSANNELIGTLRRRLKSVESLDEIDPIGHKSLHAQKYVQEQQNGTKELPNGVHEQANAARIEVNSVPKSPIAPPAFYKASVKNYNALTRNASAIESNNEIKRTIRRLKSVELLEQTEKLSDDKTELNDIQRRIQNLKTVEINKINSSSNGFSEIRTEEHKIESISVRSVTETDCFQSSPILPRRAQLFKQQQNLANLKITSPPAIHHINHGNLNYKVKPVTSFSRDLQLTPNRYPEKVPVTKTVEPEPVFFSDIKFVINSNGEVVRS